MGRGTKWLFGGLFALVLVACGAEVDVAISEEAPPAEEAAAFEPEQSDAVEFVEVPGWDEPVPILEEYAALPLVTDQPSAAHDGIVTTITAVDRDISADSFDFSRPPDPPEEGTSHVAISVEIYNPTDETINVYYNDYQLWQFAPDGTQRPGRGANSLVNFEDERQGIPLTPLVPGTYASGVLVFEEIPTDSDLQLVLQGGGRTASLSGVFPEPTIPEG